MPQGHEVVKCCFFAFLGHATCLQWIFTHVQTLNQLSKSKLQSGEKKTNLYIHVLKVHIPYMYTPTEVLKLFT